MRKILIVCPASLKINWLRELEKWLMPERKYFIGIADSRFFPAMAEIVIINYDILHKYYSELRSVTWQLIVLDEAHYAKNPKSRRSKQIYGGKGIDPIPVERKLLLTGTPIENRPGDIWALWHYLDPNNCPPNFNFMQMYYSARKIQIGSRKIWDYSTPKNLDDLQFKLRSTVMIRRKSDDVLRDLPAKRRQIIELPSNGETGLVQEEFELFKQYQSAVKDRKNLQELGESEYRQRIEGLKIQENERFSAMSNARKELAKRKVPYVVSHVSELIDSVGKVVLFAYHREVLEALHNHFGKESVLLYGGMSINQKQDAIDAFDSDPRIKVFVASIIAAGVGLNLIVSNHQVFAELDWVPGRVEQAEKRCHRIGQERPVLIQHLHFENSLDCYMAKKIIEKLEDIEKAVG